MDAHPTLPTQVLRYWRFNQLRDGSSTVLPDGCRDLIVAILPAARPRWFVSPLADTAVRVPGRAGQFIAGLRFHPAACVNQAALLAAAKRFDALDPQDLRAVVEEHVHLDARLAEVLQALACADRVAPVWRGLGVSERSLERLIKHHTGRSPGYWKSLARARRAAAALSGDLPLVEIAADHGYADQAHLNRDFRKWFSTTPARFRADPELIAMAAEPGYA